MSENNKVEIVVSQLKFVVPFHTSICPYFLVELSDSILNEVGCVAVFEPYETDSEFERNFVTASVLICIKHGSQAAPLSYIEKKILEVSNLIVIK